jgi:uncharacterized protein
LDIEDIYPLIPDFMCTPGCTECCRGFGVASRTQVENERIKEFLIAQGRATMPTQGTCCPYVSERGCTIHRVRPLICRLYGTSPNYLCKMGVKPLRPLHEDEEAEIFHFYYRYFA